MECLNQHDIYIDRFPVGDHTNSYSTFLLTHLHTDHFYIPDQFCGQLCTTSPISIVTMFLPNDCCSVRLLVYNNSYTTKKGINFQPFRTRHTPYSCGFIFPSLNIIYFGDGRLTQSMHQYMPLTTDISYTILYDGLFENKVIYGHEDHSILSHILLSPTLTDTYFAIRCVHYGILSYIKYCTQDFNIRFRIDYASVPLMIQKFIHHIDLYDANSKFIIIGPTKSYTHYILPSAMWFYIYHKDVSIYHQDNNILRVFASCHALPSQIKEWKEKYNNVHKFHPIVTRPL